MVLIRKKYKIRAFNLPPNVDVHRCEEGDIWTNLKLDELHIFLGGDQTIPHSGYDRCSLKKSADQSIEKSIWSSLSFDLESFDVGDLHDNEINNNRITIKKAGEYRIYYNISHATERKSRYQARVYKNNNSVIEGTLDTNIDSKDIASSLNLKNVSPLIFLNVDDYIELQLYHDNTGSQDVLSLNTFFGIQRVY